MVARAEYPDWAPRALAAAAIALASLFAAVGVWQAITHELFFYAPNLAISNANTDFFRVTSLFGDPSLYGRHVVLGIGVVLTLLATSRSRDGILLAALALMWAGLFFSYSQSSMAALLLVTLAIAFATGDRGVRRAVGLLALGAALVALGFGAVKVIGGESVNRVTSDRTERVEDALRVVRHDPLIGVGIGGQPRASRILSGSERPNANFVSHTTPLTVTAELGVVGLVLYVWLLVGGVRSIAGVYRSERALGLALGASLLALFVHALFYSGFLEDPLTWMVLAVAAGWLMRPGPPEPSPAERARARAARAGRRRGGGHAMSRFTGERLGRLEALGLITVLLALVTVTLPELGSDPWRFRPGAIDPSGPLAPLVRAAGEEWDVGIARAAAFLAALLCGAAALTLLRERTWPRGAGDRARAGRGRAARGALHPAPAGPARLHRAVVLHERLDLPDRAERRSGAGRREPLRPRLPPSRASSASTRATEACPSGCASARSRCATSPTSPARR